MHQIYSVASVCLVYLGEHHSDSEAAMKFIGMEDRPLGVAVKKELDSALSSFFRRQYFSRTWILQELVFEDHYGDAA